MGKLKTRCVHCFSSAKHAGCVVCNRDMCEDCVSLDERGNVCGLCYDRHTAQTQYEEYRKLVRNNPLDFEGWYDKHG